MVPPNTDCGSGRCSCFETSCRRPRAPLFRAQLRRCRDLASRPMTRLLYETIQLSPYLGGDVDLATQIHVAASAGFDGIGLDVWSLERHVEGGGSVDDVIGALARSDIPCIELQATTLHGDASDVMG